MSNSPRPSNPRFISHEIGAATLVSGERVINCWEIWMGGFTIVHRYAIDDPAQVRAAGEWAVEHHGTWRQSGFPVDSIDDVVRTFVH